MPNSFTYPINPHGYQFWALRNATVTATSNSALIKCTGARQLDLLIDAKNAPTGTNPTLKFEIDVILNDDIANASIATVQTYPGATLTGAGTDFINVENNPIGDYIQVKWTTGGANPSFTGVYAKLVWKE